MIYRFMCSFNDVFGLVVFFGYLVAFALTFLMVFIHPFVGLILLMLGVTALVVIWLVILTSRGLERSLARSGLRSGSCPFCGGEVALMAGPGDPATLHACAGCSARYEEDGRRFSDWGDEGEHGDPEGSRV
jgi:hypothetical protein